MSSPLLMGNQCDSSSRDLPSFGRRPKSCFDPEIGDLLLLQRAFLNTHLLSSHLSLLFPHISQPSLVLSHLVAVRHVAMSDSLTAFTFCNYPAPALYLVY